MSGSNRSATAGSRIRAAALVSMRNQAITGYVSPQVGSGEAPGEQLKVPTGAVEV
jgi:hypothetical protein